MKEIITAEQSSFYSKNGFLELEIPHPALEQTLDRDQWRASEPLKQFILKKIAPLALELSGKKQLRLGLTQQITDENRPAKASAIKEMFNIQGFALGAIIAENPEAPEKRSPLGMLPLPSDKDQVLFFQPHLLLDWPHLSSSICLILFTLSNAVFIHNTKDANGSYLKQFGYNYGDVLKNSSHPLIL
jgi:hypothetical protein